MLAYSRPDGGVSVVVLAPKARLVASLTPPDGLEAQPLTFDPPVPYDRIQGYVKGGWTVTWAETEAEMQTRVRGTVVPPDASNVTETDTLPSRAYRDAWRLTGGRVVHDMVAARSMKLDELRAERDKRLSATDGAFLRAQEQGDTAELDRLKSVRQNLRDLPANVSPEINGIQDADALKAWEPSWPG